MTTEKNLINLDELNKNIQLAEKQGKDIVINDQADKAVAAIKITEKQIESAIARIKEVAQEALKPFNAKTLHGKYVSITVSSPRKVNEYYVDEDAAEKFWVKQVKLIPNKEAIEAYIEKHGQLPRGVHRNELKSSVSIRLKQKAIDDVETESE